MGMSSDPKTAKFERFFLYLGFIAGGIGIMHQSYVEGKIAFGIVTIAVFCIAAWLLSLIPRRS